MSNNLKVLSLILCSLSVVCSANASKKVTREQVDRDLDRQESTARRQDTAVNVVTGRTDNRNSEQNHVNRVRQIENEFRKEEDAAAKNKQNKK